MLLLVYATVILFCFIVFRSWRAVLCAVLPLILTSILAQALMVWLHIGVKVATLPVMALGVGIGVDYALYVLGIVMKQLRAGASLSDAYHRTLLFTGKVVLLTGFTLAAGCGDLELRADQIPGRHGPAALLHVPVEHAGRHGAAALAGLFPAAAAAVFKHSPKSGA